MLLPHLPDTARVWIYQTNRELTATEITAVEQFLSEAVPQWAAHGVGMAAGYVVLHSRFVIVAADESVTQASGCSIDASGRWFKHLGQTLSLDFFDRTQLFQTPTGEWGSYHPLQAAQAVKSGLLMPEARIYTHQVQTLGQLRTQWPMPAGQLPALARAFAVA